MRHPCMSRPDRGRELWSAHLVELRRARKARLEQDDSGLGAADVADEPGWNEQLLDQLMSMRSSVLRGFTLSKSASRKSRG